VLAFFWLTIWAEPMTYIRKILRKLRFLYSICTGGKGIRGNIDGAIDDRIISGWIAQLGNPAARTFILTANGDELVRGTADQLREDLKLAGINAGAHSFIISPPPELLDNVARDLKLIDADTGTIVSRATKRFPKAFCYSDFDGWLRLSLVEPEIRAPFAEPAKRVFATMECLRKALCCEARRTEVEDLVSIIMPAYNRANVIGNAIRSVLAQSYEKFELIIVDDRSTDTTVQVAESFRDPRIRLIKLEENGGAAAARNVALHASDGSIIAYLDTDNTVAEDFLLALLGAFSRHPNADAIYCAQAVFDRGEISPKMIRFGSLNRSLLLNCNYIDLNAFAHRREMLDSTGSFDPDLARCQDWDLILRAVERCRVVSVPAILSYYRTDAANRITNDVTTASHAELVRQRAFDRMLARAECPKTLQKPVSVVIPNFEALDDLKECVNALERYHKSNAELIIVDNNSSDESRNFLIRLRDEGRATVILNTENVGFTHAVNQGIAAATPGQDIVVMNNDAKLTAGALATMQDVAVRDPSIAVVVPQQLLPGGASANIHVPYARQQFPTDVNVSAHHDNVLPLNAFHDGGELELSFAPFFCAYLRRDVLDRLGGLEAEHGRHYRSDRLYCNSVRHLLGKRVVYTPYAVVHHKVQAATNQLRSKARGEFELMLYKNQWPAALATSLGYKQAVWDIDPGRAPTTRRVSA